MKADATWPKGNCNQAPHSGQTERRRTKDSTPETQSASDPAPDPGYIREGFAQHDRVIHTP